MAWIETVPEEEADARLTKLYDTVRDPRSGRLDAIMSAHSLHPDGLAAHWAVYRAAMAGTPTLKAAEREMIALVVSAANDCHY